MEFEEKTISSETVYDGKIINVRLEKVELQDGRIADRELVGHSGGVGIIAVDNDGQVFMVSQYRIAARSIMLEIPAGKLEYGEDPLECGKRELIEETGYSAEEFIHLGEYFATPGYCEEKLNIYLARGLKFVGQKLDDGEFLNVKKYSLDELYQMVMDNKIYDAKTAIAILKAYNMRKEVIK
ncbi:MAG: NUDIX hydrolase [Clostridia bacterium]|nr:NUDIX hydrolase [Clostridia bacterium]MCI9085316.1 NUDIX hydrolase [Clostridia bacterium]